MGSDINDSSSLRPWSDLPSDLLHLISKKLFDISAFVRFRAVCSHWRAAARISDPPPQLPWILLSRRHPLRCMISLYSLPSDKTYSFRVPQSWLTHDKEMEIHGTSHHYILGHKWQHLNGPSHHYVLARNNNNSLSLFNPLTKTEIPLPHKPYNGVPYTIQAGLYENVHIFFEKGESGLSDKLLDLNYNTIENTFCYGHTFHKNKCFLIQYPGIMNIIDQVNGHIISSIPPPNSLNNSDWTKGINYLVESSGELLSIFRENFYQRLPEFWQFNVYKLLFEKDNYKWVEIKDIGDAIIFLDSRNGISVKASDFVDTEFKRNCIYFTQVQEVWHGYYKLCLYNIGDGIKKELDISLPRSGTWFLPSLH